jgi:hypothetical protein
MRIAACDEKPGECVGYPLGVRIGSVDIEMTQRCAYLTAAVDCSCQVASGPPWLMSRVVDHSTVLATRIPTAIAIA